ncbi:hypothetical protein [uncultured Gelidibacter sp.]|uniref:hypothetical protein n=1 Tax=uncultured Gelidibacter sp. TaxID=259318 RepID=UPI00261BFFC8|nr:hypothetical protein [uncultured Gelidibacter sp.]
MASSDVDGIHVINTTASRFTISNSTGEFTIPAKLNDTILFSGISYQPKKVVITKFMVASQHVTVNLEELVNALDEVVVGKILTGDLMSDLNNAPLKPQVNFYNLGIPGYTGKPKTQSERRLYEATSGGGFIPLNPILNAISGRTKELKNQVKLERLDNCLDKIKSQFAEILFAKSNLEESFKVEFFYYCQDDPRFEHLCKLNNDLATFEFLEAKLKVYNDIIGSRKE